MDTTNLEEANIGECLLDKDSVPMQEDIKKAGSIAVSLNDRTTSLCDESQEVDMSGLSRLAYSFVQRTRTETSVGRLMKASSPSFPFP